MTLKVAIIHNDPFTDIPRPSKEENAVIGVLKEVYAVRDALVELNYEWQQIVLHRPLKYIKERLATIDADVIFYIFEGFDDDPHSEPIVARMLEEIGIRFTGNPSNVLELTLDKVRTKELLKTSGIDVPDYQVLTPDTVNDFNLQFPCIIKPRDDDASHGLLPENVVDSVEQLNNQVQRISRDFRGYALVEEFIDGREFNASVIGKKELELIEVTEIEYTLPPDLPRLLTYDSKWQEDSPYYDGTGVQCPAQIEPGLRKTIEDIVLTACKTVGISGYARVDMRQHENGSIKVLEVNANPDLSPELGIALQAEKHGWSYSELVKRIIDIALE